MAKLATRQDKVASRIDKLLSAGLVLATVYFGWWGAVPFLVIIALGIVLDD